MVGCRDFSFGVLAWHAVRFGAVTFCDVLWRFVTLGEVNYD